MPAPVNLLLSELTEELIGIGINIHKILGPGFLEIVYKDAFEYELQEEEILYQREKPFLIPYKNIILPRKFHTDFWVYDKIILEIKAKKGFADEDVSQVLNYLKCSGCKVGLILNFGESKLAIKRLVL